MPFQNNKVSQVFSILYLFWWMTIPIGANVLILDLKFFVLYPNLFFSLCICLLGFFKIFKWDKYFLFLICFLLLWLIQGLVQLLVLNDKSSLAVFDFRSLVVQFITGFVIAVSFYQLGSHRFKKITVVGIRYSIFILLISGVFELITGTHISGNITNSLAELPVGLVHFAPLFVYDNPNDFIAHYLFFMVMIILFDDKWSRNVFVMISLVCACFLFSTYADCRFGKIACVILLLYYFILCFKCHFKMVYLFLGSVICTIVIFSSNPLSYGPVFDQSHLSRLNGLVVVEKNLYGNYEFVDIKQDFTEYEKNQLIFVLDSIALNKKHLNSVQIRKSLIFNGIDFMKEQPFFGVGPGQFYQRHDEKRCNHETGTVNSAHNFPIEAIATYGLIGWSYFVILLFIFYKLYIYRASNDMFISQVIAGLLLCIIWLMPSNFLYLEIHRLFLPLLIVLLINRKKEFQHVS